MTTRRATQVNVQVETLPGKFRRATQVGVQVETLPGAYRRLTQLAVMLELTAATLLPAAHYTPQIDASYLRVDQPELYGWTFAPLPPDNDTVQAGQLVADIAPYLWPEPLLQYGFTAPNAPPNQYEAAAWWPVIDATYLHPDATVVYQHTFAPLPPAVTFTLAGLDVTSALHAAKVSGLRHDARVSTTLKEVNEG